MLTTGYMGKKKSGDGENGKFQQMDQDVRPNVVFLTSYQQDD